MLIKTLSQSLRTLSVRLFQKEIKCLFSICHCNWKWVFKLCTMEIKIADIENLPYSSLIMIFSKNILIQFIQYKVLYVHIDFLTFIVQTILFTPTSPNVPTFDFQSKTLSLAEVSSSTLGAESSHFRAGGVKKYFYDTIYVIKNIIPKVKKSVISFRNLKKKLQNNNKRYKVVIFIKKNT